VVGVSESLHPQNDRIGDEGIGEAIMEFLNHYRFPPMYLTDHDNTLHETPLCPEVVGEVYYQICHEEAIYVCDDRCDTCRYYRTTFDDTWTDPRYRRRGSA
jgi:hypothetical protein